MPAPSDRKMTSRPFGSPLRYPGGKQKLSPFVVEILEANGLLGCEYVEPFAGGAGVAIELLLSGVVSRIHLNDISYHVWCFWESVKNDSESLSRHVRSATLSVEEWRRQREIFRHPNDYAIPEVGFSTFYLNRCNRSGILRGGVIGGLDQTGKWLIDARFPRNELIRRIEAIAAKSEKVNLSNLPALSYLVNYCSNLPKTSFVYCDPPYFCRAKGLYVDTFSPADHAEVAETIQTKLAVPWIVSYDNAPEIRRLYDDRVSFSYDLQYSAHSAYLGRELFILADCVKRPEKSRLSYVNDALSAINVPGGAAAGVP